MSGLPFAPPFEVILENLAAGNVVPFLGAGASLAGRPAATAWTETAPFPPRGSELSALLARKAAFETVSQDPRDRDDLLKVAAWYEQSSGRPQLVRQLHRVLARPDYQPGALHAFLASLTELHLIVTTNYDTLLERAFRAAGRPYDLVIYPKDSDATGNQLLHWPHGAEAPQLKLPGDLMLDLATTTVIFKMHGTVDESSAESGRWDNYVITEDDYVDFLSRMTSGTAVAGTILRHFRGRSFLFLGYGLADWNLRVVLRNLGREFEAQSRRDNGGTRHWAIQDAPSAIEEWLWRSRGVNVYRSTIEDFVARLDDLRLQQP